MFLRAGGTMIAKSDGKIFTYIANLSNPLNTVEPYVRDGKRCSDGQEIPFQPDLGFLGKPNMKMQRSGQMFVFIKELLEAGVFQTMAFKFHTTTDRDMLRKRLCFIRDFAAGINVPLTAIPMFLTKYKKAKSFIDQNGTPRRSEHFYLDLGLIHFIGNDDIIICKPLEKSRTNRAKIVVFSADSREGFIGLRRFPGERRGGGC